MNLFEWGLFAGIALHEFSDWVYLHAFILVNASGQFVLEGFILRGVLALICVDDLPHLHPRHCYILPCNRCMRIANKCIAMQGRVTYFRAIRAFPCIRIAKKCIAMESRVTYSRAISAFGWQIHALQCKAVLHTAVK